MTKLNRFFICKSKVPGNVVRETNESVETFFILSFIFIHDRNLFILLTKKKKRKLLLVFLYFHQFIKHTHGKTINVPFQPIDTNLLNDLWLDKTSSLYFIVYFSLPEIYMAYVQNCHQSEVKKKTLFNIAN